MNGLYKVSPLAAVILAGGQSSRMGKDKAWLVYHNKAQIFHLSELLSNCKLPVFISANQWPEDQTKMEFYPDHPELSGHGPISGLLSIHRLIPDHALLLIGCDYPNLGKSEIEQICTRRNPNFQATAFVNSDGMLEPLCTVYEPEFLLHIQQSFLREGKDSLRRFLQDAQVQKVQSISENLFFSADAPEDFLRWKQEKLRR